MIKKPTCGPIIKGVINDKSTSQINIWARGKKCRNNEQCYVISRLCGVRTLEEYIDVQKAEQIHDYIVTARYTDLDNSQEYVYDIGYIHAKSLDNLNALEWKDACRGVVKLDSYDEVLFAFGSCRYHLACGPFDMFGTGKEGDKIYQAILEKKVDFFISLGDQIYLDSLGSLARSTELDEIRRKYRKIFSYPCIQRLFSSVPIYAICDDHDIHRNNTNQELQLKDHKAYNNAVRAYLEYQYHGAPCCSKIKLYYTFDRADCTFFVMDTRTERTLDNIVSPEQMDAVESWAHDPANQNKIKFLVSSVPVVSQDDPDSFFGFPKQQKQLIELLYMSGLTNVFLLVGDAHCARVAQYTVSPAITITEIMSSGLVAVKHDTQYKNFPNMIDNRANGGLCFKMIGRVDTYPNPHKPNSIAKKLKYPFKIVADNVFVTIAVKNDCLQIGIYNHKGNLLDMYLHDLS